MVSNITLGEARAAFLERNGFGPDGGYSKRWLRITAAAPIPLYLPNTAGVRRALPLHDLHHVLTGYETDWSGEAEIAAWELASGCGDHFCEWWIDLVSVAIGLVIGPRRTLLAFLRGRISRSLFRETFSESLLHESLASMRARLGLLGDAPAPTMRDVCSFIRLAFAAILTTTLSIALALAPIALCLAGIVG